MNFLKRYNSLLLLAVVYIAIALTQLPIIENFWRYSFDDGTYSHAFLIPFICIYLYWLLFQSGELIFNKKIHLVALISVILTSYILWVSINAQFPTGYRISFILFIAAITTLIFKPSIKVLFPALFLIFLTPIWGAATVILQNISTYAVTYLMNLSGIPIFVEGNTIAIPSGVFEIAGGCSGLRYLIVSLAISSLFIFLNIRKYSHAVLFISIAIIGALITNWIRITALIVIGHVTEMQSDLMQDHNSFGWYIYMPFMAWLFYFGQRYVIAEDKKVTKISQTTIEYKNVVLCLTAIILISNPLRNLLLTSSSEGNQCLEINSIHPTPDLFLPAAQCNITANTQDKFTITYIYNDAKLEGAVDYYLNEFTPQHWLIESTLQTDESNNLVVSKNGQYYQISYLFESHGIATSSLKTLKKLKLLQALTKPSVTKLKWQATRCENKCRQL